MLGRLARCFPSSYMSLPFPLQSLASLAQLRAERRALEQHQRYITPASYLPIICVAVCCCCGWFYRKLLAARNLVTFIYRRYRCTAGAGRRVTVTQQQANPPFSSNRTVSRAFQYPGMTLNVTGATVNKSTKNTSTHSPSV